MGDFRIRKTLRKKRRQYSIDSYIDDFQSSLKRLKDLMNKSTTPATESLYNTIIIITLCPPLLQKEGKVL
jgi:hypothetical protein